MSKGSRKPKFEQVLNPDGSWTMQTRQHKSNKSYNKQSGLANSGRQAYNKRKHVGKGKK